MIRKIFTGIYKWCTLVKVVWVSKTSVSISNYLSCIPHSLVLLMRVQWLIWRLGDNHNLYYLTGWGITFTIWGNGSKHLGFMFLIFISRSMGIKNPPTVCSADPNIRWASHRSVLTVGYQQGHFCVLTKLYYPTKLIK